MEHYFIQFQFSLVDKQEFEIDLFTQELADIGFESFDHQDQAMNAYISNLNYNEVQFIATLQAQETEWTYTQTEVAIENWNEQWEKNFSPIKVGDKCYVRADFHPSLQEYKYQIVINPKMAFGTGHHATTYMMLDWQFEFKLRNKIVLDMGCGTAILAILAEMLGAKSITAIDNDPIAIESAKECIAVNKCTDIKALVGDKSMLGSLPKQDIIFANINRNILLDQLEVYANLLVDKGLLLLSGFYQGNDAQAISARAQELGFKIKGIKIKDQWASIACVKDTE